MIAIIISNDTYTVNQVSQSLKKNGYDVINYKDLRKAMDNLIEINPDVIALSAQEYPRHWKVLGSYINSLFENADLATASAKRPSLILIDEKQDENVKSDAAKIGVKGILNSCSDEGLSQLNSFLGASAPITKTVLGESQAETEFVFTNPYTDVFVTGTVQNYSGNQMYFIPDILTHTSQIEIGTVLENCTLLSNQQAKNVKAQVLSTQSTEPYALGIVIEE